MTMCFLKSKILFLFGKNIERTCLKYVEFLKFHVHRVFSIKLLNVRNFIRFLFILTFFREIFLSNFMEFSGKKPNPNFMAG